MAKRETFGTERARGVFCVIPQRAVHDTRLQKRPKTLLVLLAIANFSNRQGVSFPNQKTLASDLNIKQPTISKHIKLLMEYGYLRYATKKFNKALSYRSNAYFMVFDEDITEQDAKAVQTSKDLEQIEEQDNHNMSKLINRNVDNSTTKEPNKPPNIHSERIPDIHSERISNTDINTNIKYISISRDIINGFKKILEETYGHVAIWKEQDIEIVSSWLQQGHKPEYILSRIKGYLEYRKKNGQDSIKRITYFDKVFLDSKGPKDKKAELSELLNKFTATHKVRW